MGGVIVQGSVVQGGLFRSNCLGVKVRGNCPGGNFMWGNCSVGSYPGKNYSGGVVWGGKSPEGNCPGGISWGEIVRGRFVQRGMVIEPG